MEIILLEKINNVGGIGDKVTVKPGYARNYLIPQGKATVATAANIAKFEARRGEIEAKAYSELEAAQARANQLEGKVLRITANAGSEGRLYGSVGTSDIAEACKALGLEIERSEVRLPDGPLRAVGEHQIDLHLRSDVNVPMTVIVEGENAKQWVDEKAAASSDDQPEADESDDAPADAVDGDDSTA
jgi:large subunit ribosomal protein L9